MALEIQHIVSQRFVQCMKSLLDGHGVSSARQLALSMNYKPQGLSEIMLGKRNAPVELIKRAAEVHRVNVRYLFFGEGEMFDLPGQQNAVMMHVLVTDTMQKERIVHVPVTAHAGYRENLAEPVFFRQLPTFALPENILGDGSYRSFEVEGSSMEPTILPGDKVIGAYVEPQFWEQGIKDNMVYVLVTDDSVVVKRVVNFIRGEKMLELHSDNKTFRPDRLPANVLREVWLVRLRITAHLRKPENVDIQALDGRLKEQTLLLEELKNTMAHFTDSSLPL